MTDHSLQAENEIRAIRRGRGLEAGRRAAGHDSLDDSQRREDRQRVTFRSAQPGHDPLAGIVPDFAPQEGRAPRSLLVRGTRRPGPYAAFEPSLNEDSQHERKALAFYERNQAAMNTGAVVL